MYEVENVLDHRPLKKGRRISWQFLIKWKGYAHEYNFGSHKTTLQAKTRLWDPIGAIGGEPPLPKTKTRQLADRQTFQQDTTRQDNSQTLPKRKGRPPKNPPQTNRPQTKPPQTDRRAEEDRLKTLVNAVDFSNVILSDNFMCGQDVHT